MKIVGQPTSYSEILQRIFYLSTVSGIICTIILSNTSPEIRTFLDSFETEVDLGPLKSVKVLYVFIPLVIGLFSRMLKLHDRISDILGIRHRFDNQHILFPLSEKVGIDLTNDYKAKIRKNRNDLMSSIFYKYASFENPTIDLQLVRTAADNWGWFWVLLESSFLFFITAIITKCTELSKYGLWCTIVVFIELILIFYFWNECKKSASRQIQAILNDEDRKSDILYQYQLIETHK